jgi:uncharacterized phage-associated protein
MTIVSARDVAKWFLAFAGDLPEDDADMTNLKLQKLLYYAQGHWLAEHGEPLFPENIKAWTHGPVVPQVWHDYKDAGRGLLSAPSEEEFNWNCVPSEVDDFLVRIWREYSGYSASGLRSMTHSEPPWRDAFATSDESPKIGLEALLTHFRAHPLPA